MQNKILFSLIGVLTVIAIGLGIKIYLQHQRTLGINVTEIPKSSLLFPKNGNYRYFYEPKPNSVITVEGELAVELGYPAGTVVKNTINADSLNQIPNYTPKKPESVYRILTLGDSFTYGEKVNTEDNYPSQLERKLNESLKCKNISSFQVINLGMGGYDIAYSIERYKLRGQKYNPDLVLWFIIQDDLTRIIELQQPRTEYYDAKLKASGEADILQKKGIFYRGWRLAQDEIIKSFGGEDNMFKVQKKYFSEISNYFKGPLVIFNYPSEQKYSDVLADFAKSRKNTTYHIIQVPQGSDYFLKDSHPSSKGYTTIVNDLYDYLAQNKLIPCEKP